MSQSEDIKAAARRALAPIAEDMLEVERIIMREVSSAVSRVDEVGHYITAAGGANAFGEISKAWDAVEPSAVAVADPWCIIIHDYEGSSYDEKVAALKADPQLSQLDCVKNERFVRLSLEDAMPGMRCVSTVEAIAQVLYPEKL